MIFYRRGRRAAQRCAEESRQRLLPLRGFAATADSTPQHRSICPRACHSEAGFTLLEILVVMALLLIVTGLAVVRLDDSGERVTRAQAEQLSLRLEAARDEAVYAGQPLAFSSDGVGYQFWLGDVGRRQWFAMPENSELRPQILRDEVRLVQQTVNGRPSPLGERLVFNADGLSEPFSLLLQGGKKQLQVVSDALGRVSIEEVANAAP